MGTSIIRFSSLSAAGIPPSLRAGNVDLTSVSPLGAIVQHVLINNLAPEEPSPVLYWLVALSLRFGSSLWSTTAAAALAGNEQALLALLIDCPSVLYGGSSRCLVQLEWMAAGH